MDAALSSAGGAPLDALRDAALASPLAGTGTRPALSGNAKKTAQDFESMFMSQMLQPMFATVSSEGDFMGGSAEETYRGMLTNEYGKLMSKAGGLGIAQSVQAELLRQQEHAA